ncbi:hypothetical protein RE628_20110 [Paenibacillus sp. D2_2]|uniref:hypothetical protein n=1 Tax=Paenibacillus sp. D2_2 TaxID=3073092 RepID=UPI002816683E|nr:hypothetical protein [Paenibacillus sp. D2_2]WMT39686.1 hypothetical protein RE628_20110 [Paenibacillus sp. D2_2]
MRIFMIIVLAIILTSCSQHEMSFDDVVKSQAHAKEAFKRKGYITATASKQNELVKFRIMVIDKITNDNARELAEEFINLMETQIKDKELFNKRYQITFDIKSEKDGNILFNGKRDKGTTDIWWQF